MNWILILFIVGGGGSGPRPAASIESVVFSSESACNTALEKSTSIKIPSVGPHFKVVGFCTKEGEE